MLQSHQEKLRFLVVGGINTLFGIAAYPMIYLLLAGLDAHYLVILVISQIVCVSFSFMTNKYFVFRTTGNYWREYQKFWLLHLGAFAINLLVLPLAVDGLKMNPMIAQTAYAIVMAIISYFWHSKITFSSANHEVSKFK